MKVANELKQHEAVSSFQEKFQKSLESEAISILTRSGNLFTVRELSISALSTGTPELTR